jgi:rod shape-determining protein MreB and related proteins
MPRKSKDSACEESDSADTEKEELFIGIDFGTSKTAVVASNGVRECIATVVGYPKDMIAAKFLQKTIVLGNDAVKNRLALTMYKPIEKGIMKNTDKDKEAARELLKYVIALATKKKKYKKVRAVIGTPAQTDHVNKQALHEVCQNLVDAVIVVSEPFTIAYSCGSLNNSIIVDIGAGTTDLCRMHGSLPNETDELCNDKAGDHIDNQLMTLIQKRYKGAQITKTMCTEWKEKYGFTVKSEKPISVEVPLEGKQNMVDITPELQKACESIVPEIVDGITKLVSTYDPEFQEELKANILIGGGGSQIRNLDECIELNLKKIGGGKVKVVKDPVFAGAEGALNLGIEMPAEYWEQV